MLIRLLHRTKVILTILTITPYMVENQNNPCRRYDRQQPSQIPRNKPIDYPDYKNRQETRQRLIPRQPMRTKQLHRISQHQPSDNISGKHLPPLESKNTLCRQKLTIHPHPVQQTQNKYYRQRRQYPCEDIAHTNTVMMTKEQPRTNRRDRDNGYILSRSNNRTEDVSRNKRR